MGALTLWALWQQEFCPSLRAVDVPRPQFGRQAVAFTVEQHQRVIAGRLEVPIVGALLLMALDPNLGAVHVQHDALGRVDGFRLGDQLSIDRGQSGEILFLGKQVGLE